MERRLVSLDFFLIKLGIEGVPQKPTKMLSEMFYCTAY